MAIKSLIQSGYGQVELNDVAFRRDGRIEAQFPMEADLEFMENGAIYALDGAKGEVKEGSDEALAAGLPLALHYSAERLHDERLQGLKNFRLTPDRELPRLGYLSVGDQITTNNAEYDDEDFADLAALKAAAAAGTLFAVGGKSARWVLTADAAVANAVVAQVKFTTMPDGQPAVGLYVIKV